MEETFEIEKDIPMPKKIAVEYDALNNEPAIEGKPKIVDLNKKNIIEENYEQTTPSDK